MTYEAAVCKTERTFSEAEIVSYYTEVKVSILVLCEHLSEKIELSVEAVIESDLINAPVSPVFDMLYSCRISIETKCYENVLEFSLYILDKDRRIKSKCSYAKIVHLVDKITYLLAHYRIDLVLIH